MAVHGLFGRQVVGGAEDGVAVVLLGERLFVVVEEAGQAEVEDLDDAGAVHEQVGRLDVAVDQAGLVGVLQAEGGLMDVVGGANRVKRAAALDQVLEADAVDVLHDEEVEFAVPVHVVGADDVGMAQLGDGLGLAVEAFDRAGVVGLAAGSTLMATGRRMILCEQR